jgi:hypothetical protein
MSFEGIAEVIEPWAAQAEQILKERRAEKARADGGCMLIGEQEQLCRRGRIQIR